MKRIFTLAVAALLFAGSAMAQDTKKETRQNRQDKEARTHQKHERHGKHDGAGIAKELNLSDSQKDQVKSLNKEYKQKAEALRQERKTRTEAILTAEQKAKLGELKEKRKNEFKNKRAGKMEGMKKELGISEAQGQKIKALNEEFRTKAEAIKNNSSLTQEQKKEQFKALNDERKAKMKNILTAEQLQKMESRREKGQFKNKRGTK
jgi:Spy/CpxP family protein refolding chaperone